MKKDKNQLFEKLDEANFRQMPLNEKANLYGGLVASSQITWFRDLVQTGTPRLSAPDYQYNIATD